MVVAAAAGGVGSVAVQLAARRERQSLAGTASGPNHDYVRAFGAADVVDYRSGDWVAEVRTRTSGGADALLEAYGGETKRRAPEAVHDGGRLVWIAGDPAPASRGMGSRDRVGTRVPFHHACGLRSPAVALGFLYLSRLNSLGSSGLEPLHQEHVDFLDVLDDEVDQLAGRRRTKVPPTHGTVGVGSVVRWSGPGRELKDAGDLGVARGGPHPVGRRSVLGPRDRRRSGTPTGPTADE